MANKNRTGFYPVGTLTGAPWTASVRRCLANNILSNVTKGSLVGYSAGADGTVEVINVYNTNVIGAVVGIEPVIKSKTSVQGASLSLEQIYIPKSATAAGKYVQVVFDPFCIYETVTANGTIIGSANIGEQYSLLATAGGQQSPDKTPQGSGTIDVGCPAVAVANMFLLQDIGFDTLNDGTSNATYSDVNTTVRVILSASMLKAAKASPG